MRLLVLLWALLPAAALPSSSSAPPVPAPARCENDPEFRRLDFWIGDWDVYDRAARRQDGVSSIRKILRGCAIEVDFHEVDGTGNIHELFFYEKPRHAWHQVWVSEAGFVKERLSTEDRADGSIRFLGEIPHLAGGSHLDRSTVAPAADGRILQLIEISKDGGATWTTTFDGEYRRSSPPSAPSPPR